VAVDLTTGKPLFMRNSDLSLAPASNEKLPVTFAALRELGTS
jgi:D-alanyl-D-alanine carboxypeptidase